MKLSELVDYSSSKKFPKIDKAILAIALDNGAVNRLQTKEFFIEKAWVVIKGHFSESELSEIELFLNNLTEDEFETLTCGEQGIIVTPDKVQEVLNTIFDSI